MSDLLEFIVKQNLVNERLLQLILIHLGVDKKNLDEYLEMITNEVNKELNNE